MRAFTWTFHETCSRIRISEASYGVTTTLPSGNTATLLHHTFPLMCCFPYNAPDGPGTLAGAVRRHVQQIVCWCSCGGLLRARNHPCKSNAYRGSTSTPARRPCITRPTQAPSPPIQGRATSSGRAACVCVGGEALGPDHEVQPFWGLGNHWG